MASHQQVILAYTLDSDGYWPFALSDDRQGGYIDPGGNPVNGYRYLMVGGLWHLPILESYKDDPYSTSLICPADEETLAMRDQIASDHGVDPQQVIGTLPRHISSAMYLTPKALEEDRNEWSSTYARVSRASEVTFPSSKSLLVEALPFHEAGYESGSVSESSRLVVGSVDGAIAWRRLSDAVPAVILDTQRGDSDLRRAMHAFDTTRGGVRGRDW